MFGITREQHGLAGRTLSFLAAVHQGDALPKCGLEHGLVLVHRHVHADGFESNGISHTREPILPAEPGLLCRVAEREESGCIAVTDSSAMDSF